MMNNMSMPPVPPHLEDLGNRHFSFHPPILNIGPNHWLYRSATWNELMVRNARTAQDISVPRRFVGETSRLGDSVAVSLLRELEFRDGVVAPYRSQVIAMPVAVNGPPVVNQPRPQRKAPVVNISLAATSDSRAGRMAASAIAVGVAVCVVMAGMSRFGVEQPLSKVETARDQAYLDLGPEDDAASIARKLGAPDHQVWRDVEGPMRIRALYFAARGYSVILLGAGNDEPRYVGTFDGSGVPLHSVPLTNVTGGRPQSHQRRHGF